MVGSEAAERLLTGLSDVRDNLVTAVDGATQLDGRREHRGIRQRDAGRRHGQLADGTAQLATGAQTLASGAQTLASGAQQVSDGNRQLADVADRAGSAVQQAANALPQVRTDIATALDRAGVRPRSRSIEVLAKLDPLGARPAGGQRAGAGRCRQGRSARRRRAQSLASGASQLASGADARLRRRHGRDRRCVRERRGRAAARRTRHARRPARPSCATGSRAGSTHIPASTPELRTQQADTIADPVQVSSDKVASAEDYGAGLAPFFAALVGLDRHLRAVPDREADLTSRDHRAALPRAHHARGLAHPCHARRRADGRR